MTPAQLERPVTTTLIHRCAHAPLQWWHQAVICDFVGAAHRNELDNIKSLIIDLARVGFRAIALRPAPEFLTAPSPELTDLRHRPPGRHQSPPAHPPPGSTHARHQPPPPGAVNDDEATAVCAWTQNALAAGADGIDLALLETTDAPLPAEQREHLAALIRRIHSEIADSTPSATLSAEALTNDEATLTYHLEEEWLHHLRDGPPTPLARPTLRANVERALAQRDYLGHVAAWHWSRTRHVEAPGDVFTMQDIPTTSWEHASDPARRTAMNLYALSLPGAAYIPFAFMGGRLVASSNMFRRVWEGDKDSAAEARTLREVLRVREERAMGTGSLAWVDGLAWAHEGVNVHLSAGVLVVLNTSDQVVEVPAEHRLLVCSTPVAAAERRPTTLPGNSCAWFETAKIQRRPVSFND
ncbi:hypothetical protein [Schaalia sp. Marseille-Q2122]|uniref:hypothetical protein n=1 Tax=Schaalia sp. Marseille-Q2122 TaxID=2736604 RepID=UPI00158B6207|nr:hypothetical protein [Schaalia sp. Marseille-Q2122]